MGYEAHTFSEKHFASESENTSKTRSQLLDWLKRRTSTKARCQLLAVTNSQTSLEISAFLDILLQDWYR